MQDPSVSRLASALMRAVIQRVDHASVAVEGDITGRIGPGLLVLLGVSPDDTQDDALVLAAKLVDLRVFADDDGRFNRSLRDVGGAMLVVSQFTLFGDVRKGRRPSFTAAASPQHAEPLVDVFATSVAGDGFEVATGVFGAMMDVELLNSGPFTLLVETSKGRII